MSDARTGQRFPLKLPVRIQGANSGRSLAGVTHDMSAAGVYLSASVPMKMGAKIKFRITLPGKEIGAKRDISIQCLGRVVRIDRQRSGARRGIACVIDSYKYVRASGGKA